MTTFAFEGSITIRGNNGNILVPDFEYQVEVDRDMADRWYVHRIWEIHFNGEPTELLIGGSLVETAIFTAIADAVELDQGALDRRYYEAKPDRPEPSECEGFPTTPQTGGWS
jgi:hypothetical protein